MILAQKEPRVCLGVAELKSCPERGEEAKVKWICDSMFPIDFLEPMFNPKTFGTEIEVS